MMMIAVERCTFNDTHFNGPETVQHRHGYWLDLQTIQFTHALLTGVISTAQKRYNTDMVTG